MRDATRNYITGMIFSPPAVVNMYIFGAGITSAVKIFFASAGLYTAANHGNLEAIPEFLMVVIETMMPIFLTVDGGFVRTSEAVLTVVLNVGIGLAVAGAKYDIATRGRY